MREPGLSPKVVLLTLNYLLGFNSLPSPYSDSSLRSQSVCLQFGPRRVSRHTTIRPTTLETRSKRSRHFTSIIRVVGDLELTLPYTLLQIVFQTTCPPRVISRQQKYPVNLKNSFGKRTLSSCMSARNENSKSTLSTGSLIPFSQGRRLTEDGLSGPTRFWDFAGPVPRRCRRGRSWYLPSFRSD